MSSILNEMRQQAIHMLRRGDIADAVDAIHDAAREIAQEELTKAVGRLELDARNEDEKRAWDGFAAAFVAHVDEYTDAGPAGIAHDAANYADKLLEERRKRWSR